MALWMEPLPYTGHFTYRLTPKHSVQPLLGPRRIWVGTVRGTTPGSPGVLVGMQIPAVSLPRRVLEGGASESVPRSTPPGISLHTPLWEALV